MKDKLSFSEKTALDIIKKSIEYNKEHYHIDFTMITNSKIARQLDVETRTVSRYIRKLYQLEYIDVILYDNNRRDIRVGKRVVE